eukprot:PhM_4_TR17461/c2_g1_i1/m.85755
MSVNSAGAWSWERFRTRPHPNLFSSESRLLLKLCPVEHLVGEIKVIYGNNNNNNNAILYGGEGDYFVVMTRQNAQPPLPIPEVCLQQQQQQEQFPQQQQSITPMEYWQMREAGLRQWSLIKSSQDVEALLRHAHAVPHAKHLSSNDNNDNNDDKENGKDKGRERTQRRPPPAVVVYPMLHGA